MEMMGELMVEVRDFLPFLEAKNSVKTGFGGNLPYLPPNQIGFLMNIDCSNNPLGNAGNDDGGGGNR